MRNEEDNTMEKWIIPCNPKFFDVVNHFNSNSRIVWKRTSPIHKDDIVYIYVGKPYSEIKYRCHVIEEHLSEDIIKENSYAISRSAFNTNGYIMLEMDYTFPEGTLDLQSLKEHGLGQVQRQARIYKELVEYINSKEPEITEKRGQ